MRAFVVPLAPRVAALYTVKAVVLPEPLPNMFVPAASEQGSGKTLVYFLSGQKTIMHQSKQQGNMSSTLAGSTRREQAALAFQTGQEGLTRGCDAA